jgi:hypothetical protein
MSCVGYRNVHVIIKSGLMSYTTYAEANGCKVQATVKFVPVCSVLTCEESSYQQVRAIEIAIRENPAKVHSCHAYMFTTLWECSG